MDSSARHQNRHSHIGIRLGHRVAGVWETVEALGWNQAGFNYFTSHAVVDSPMELKRGLTRFEGTVMWTAINTDDAIVLNALINTHIYQRAQEVVSSNPDGHLKLPHLWPPKLLRG